VVTHTLTQPLRGGVWPNATVGGNIKPIGAAERGHQTARALSAAPRAPHDRAGTDDCHPQSATRQTVK